jgi:hypothetical protein
MLGITAFNLVTVTLQILEYKKYYDRVPLFLRNYLQEKTVRILGGKIKENPKELYINIALLLILIILNIVIFLI